MRYYQYSRRGHIDTVSVTVFLVCGWVWVLSHLKVMDILPSYKNIYLNFSVAIFFYNDCLTAKTFINYWLDKTSKYSEELNGT